MSRSDEIDEATVDYALVTEAQGQPLETQPTTLTRTHQHRAEGVPAPSIRNYQPVGTDDRDYISAALLRHGGHKSRTAKALNLTLRQLNYRIEILGIVVPARRSNNL